MIISVLSGKGGTGKTTVAVNLAALIEGSVYMDCDVEEPNGFIFLKPVVEQTIIVKTMVPEIDSDLCTGCGKCSEFCYFHALALVRGKVIVFPEICHGCGGCMMVCGSGAIGEGEKHIGIIETGSSGKTRCIRGVLDVGEPAGTPIIKEMKKIMDRNASYILDCPPGASCLVVNSVEGSDFAVLVAEPTNFGLHDLKIAVEVLEDMDIPKGVIINRSGDDDSIIEEFCRDRNIAVLGKIPFQRRIAELYSRGQLLIEHDEYRSMFEAILRNLRGAMGHEAADNN